MQSEPEGIKRKREARGGRSEGNGREGKKEAGIRSVRSPRILWRRKGEKYLQNPIHIWL
jgi:hypothetical protein